MTAEMGVCQSAYSSCAPGIGIGIGIGGTVVLLVHASATRAYAREMTVPFSQSTELRHLPCHPRSSLHILPQPERFQERTAARRGERTE